jgi:hypothetical protein
MQRQILALADVNENLIAGGRFESAGGVEAHSIALWDGIQWSSMGSGTNGVVSHWSVQGHPLRRRAVHARRGIAFPQHRRMDPERSRSIL